VGNLGDGTALDEGAIAKETLVTKHMLSGRSMSSHSARVAIARVSDVAGLLLLMWLGWQVMFGGSQIFETPALWVGLLGAIACLADPAAVRNAPWPMLAYVGVALLSAATHQRRAPVTPAQPEWSTIVDPALYLVVMAIFVYGVSYLLRTRQRLSVFAVLMVGSIGVLGAQIVFDRATTNFEYLLGGSVSLPSVSQWAGLHQTGLLLVLALPMVFSLTVASRSVWRVATGLFLGGTFMTVAYLNGSRSGIMAMAVTMAVMAFSLMVTSEGRGWLHRASRIALVVIPLALVGAIFAGATSLIPVTSVSGGRAQIWRAAAALFRDNLWLGAGPGNYGNALVLDGYAEEYLPLFPYRLNGLEQAHNLLLQVGAETGVFGLLFFLLFFGWMFRACWRTRSQGHVPLVAFGVLFALAGFFLRSTSDNFLDLQITSDRIRPLVWAFFAAALALERLPRSASADAPIVSTGPDRRRLAFAVTCLAALGVEGYLLLGARTDTFRIIGKDDYEVTAFTQGSLVSHAFLMRGEGLHSLQVMVASDQPASARIQWQLWRGYVDSPPKTLALEGVAELTLEAGRKWITLAVTRDGSSHDRWYSLELKLIEPLPAGRTTPAVSLVASHDNPDRGGVLFIDGVRTPGSLLLQAHRRGRTLYRRYLAEAAPNMPVALRSPAAHWLAFGLLHLAFFAFAYAMMSDAWNSPAAPSGYDGPNRE
jgi:O-antigen ligase